MLGKLVISNKWTANQKVAIQPFQDARYGIKKKPDEFTKDETQEALEKQLTFNRRSAKSKQSSSYNNKRKLKRP